MNDDEGGTGIQVAATRIGPYYVSSNALHCARCYNIIRTHIHKYVATQRTQNSPKKHPNASPFLSTGANVTVVPEFTYVQNNDVLNKTGSASFVGRVVAVGDKVKTLKVDDFVFSCDNKVAAEGYNKIEAKEASFVAVGDEEYLDPLVGAVLPSQCAARACIKCGKFNNFCAH